MSNLCNSPVGFGLNRCTESRNSLVWLFIFAISLGNHIWCCWEEECELISFVPALQNGISSSVTATAFVPRNIHILHASPTDSWAVDPPRGRGKQSDFTPEFTLEFTPEFTAEFTAEFTPGSVAGQGMLPCSHSPGTAHETQGSAKR